MPSVESVNAIASSGVKAKRVRSTTTDAFASGTASPRSSRDAIFAASPEFLTPKYLTST